MSVFIIAEAGVNHNGDIDTAIRLINVAAEAGADAVKFQTIRTDTLVIKTAPKAQYQTKNTHAGESQREMLKKLELTASEHRTLISHCKNRGIVFLSTPFDIESINLLNELGIETFKIPSGEITNLPYLRKVGSLKKQIILSTGMSDIGEIETALNVLVRSGTMREKIVVLHCNTQYPTPYKDVNLLAMVTIRDALKIAVGYSDHTLGIEIPIAAVAMGAVVIEKHFTLDRSMKGPDHEASLEPGELAEMVHAVRNVSVALGDGLKRPMESESENIIVVRKSIVAAKKIKKGEFFTEDNITSKRPALGLSPMLWDHILGRQALHDYEEDDLVQLAPI
ncbi:MAG: N-acetylneuraminate synthase [Nitrospirae bacterium]|nr:N-acetylneuraminate synthase [Nitrospirota bacterium]